MSPDRKTRPAFECEVSPMSSDICHRCSRTKLLPMFPLAHWFELCVRRTAATRAANVTNENRAETSGDRFLDEEIAGCAHG